MVFLRDLTRKAKALPAHLQENAIRMIGGVKQQLEEVFAELRNRGQENLRTSPEPDYPGETGRDTPTQEAHEAWVDANWPLDKRSNERLLDDMADIAEEIEALQSAPRGSEDMARMTSRIAHGRNIRDELRKRGFKGNSDTYQIERSSQIWPDRRRWPPNLAAMFKKSPREWSVGELHDNMARLARLSEEYEVTSKDPQSKALLLTLMKWVQNETLRRGFTEME